MSAITIRAQDTHAAMEEVLRQLGPDALILSINSRDGMIELHATNEDATPETTADTTFDALWSEAQARAGSGARQPASGDLADEILPETPVDLAAAQRVVIFGPQGSGRSTLALQIAAMALIAGRQVELIAPRPAGRTAFSDLLQTRAPLFGLSVLRPSLSGLMKGQGQGRALQIVDLSHIENVRPDVIQRLGGVSVLTLQSGLKPQLIRKICAPFKAVGALVALTRADVWEPDHDDLAALRDSGLRLGWVGPGATLAADPVPASRAHLRRWLDGITGPNALADEQTEYAPKDGCLLEKTQSGGTEQQ